MIIINNEMQIRDTNKIFFQKCRPILIKIPKTICIGAKYRCFKPMTTTTTTTDEKTNQRPNIRGRVELYQICIIYITFVCSPPQRTYTKFMKSKQMLRRAPS